MSLVWAHSRWMIFELWRQPAYVVSTVCFPALFYLIFAVPESNNQDAANFLLASFSGFAVFGVFFLQIGVSLAQERSRSWYTFLKLLPIRGWQLFSARLISAMAFAMMAVALLWVLSLWQTEAVLSLKQSIYFILSLLSGSVLFCLMGITLGLWCDERAALPVGNLIYLPLSFAGGLWKPPEILPSSIRQISEILPTRYFGETLWAAVRGEWADASIWWGLVTYFGAFALLAYSGFRREIVRSRT